MFCANHPDIEASKPCDRCGRFACPACLSDNPGATALRCVECVAFERKVSAKEEIAKSYRHLAYETLFYAVAAIALLLVAGNAVHRTGKHFSPAGLAVLAACFGLPFIVAAPCFLRQQRSTARIGLILQIIPATAMLILAPGLCTAMMFLAIYRSFTLLKHIHNLEEDRVSVDPWTASLASRVVRKRRRE